MVRYAARRGVRAIGATLSAEQAAWARAAIEAEGLGELAEVRHCDYRDVGETGFDAVSSIGLTEHIGVKNYPSYFEFLKSKLRTDGLLLNHCITRDNNTANFRASSFTDRYVFPDAELTGSGRIFSAIQDVGFEVLHAENFRHHYAMTLRDWSPQPRRALGRSCRRGRHRHREGMGLVHGGSRVAFEQNNIQLHHVLACKLDEHGPATCRCAPGGRPAPFG